MGANTVGQAIVSTAVAYLDNVVTYPYINSKFAILSRIKDDYGQDIIRTMPEYGEGFAFREIVGGTASDYDTDTGFGADCGATADYTVVKGYYDREFPARTDWASEMNTVLQGGTPTIVGKVAATWKNFGAEIDAVTAAYIYDKAKESNKHLNTDSKYATNSGSAIVSTLLRIKNDLYDHATLAYQLYDANDDSQKATARSLFSKKATGHPDADGQIRRFDDIEINKLYDLLRTKK